MNRFARVTLIAMMACVLTVTAVGVSTADTGKRGTSQQIQRTGQMTPGVLRPSTEFAVQGGKGENFGQYFDYGRVFSYLYAYYKYFYVN